MNELVCAAYLEVGEGYPKLWVIFLGEEQIPQATLLGFDFELFGDRNDSLPSLYRVCWQLRFPDPSRRFKLVL